MISNLFLKRKILESAFSGRFSDDDCEWSEKNIDDVLISIPVKSFQINQTEIKTSGSFPVISQSKVLIEGYSDEKDKLLDKYNDYIIFGDHSKTVKYIDFPFIVGADGTKVFSSIDNNVKYLYYHMLYNSFFINSSGYTRNYKYLKEFKYNIPPKEEQDRIANILDDMFELVEKKEKNDQEKERLLEVIKGKILDSAIHGKLVDNNVNARPVEVDVIGGDVPFEIPSNWKWTILSNFALIKARIGWQGLTRDEHLDTGDYYLITGTDFKNGLIDYSHCSYVTKERFDMDTNIQLKENDVLLTKDGTIGKSAIVKNLDKPATLNSGVFLIRSSNEEILNEYIQLFFNTKYFNDFVDSFKNGMTVAHLTQKSLVKFPLPVPPLEEQNKIIKKIGSLFELIEQL